MTDGEICEKFDELRKNAAEENLIVRADCDKIVVGDMAFDDLTSAAFYFRGYRTAMLTVKAESDPLTQLDEKEETGWKDI